MKSIQTRLNVGFITLSLVVFVVLWLANGWFLRQTAYEFVGDRLTTDAYALLRAVEVEPDGDWQLNADLVDPVYQQPMSGHYFQIAVGEDWHYSRSLWDDRIPSDGRGMQIGQQMVKLVHKGRSKWLVRESRFMKDGQTVHLLLAQDVGGFEKGLARLGWMVAGLGVVFLLALLVIQVLVIRSGLRALVRVQGDIGELKKGEIRQLPHSDTCEVEPLVTEINYLVQSMELRLQRSRSALGNLAHAAKTPLTVLDRQIESLNERDPEHGQAMQEQSMRLRELMERELTRARIAGAALPGQRIYIREELDKLERTLKTIYRDKALEFELALEENSYFPGERDDLVELLGNLLDNACKWADSRIRVQTLSCEDHLNILIEDDGPGIADDQIDRLLNRGERLDESTVGHGLGMSIISDIVQQYQGRMQLMRSESLKGLKVALCLPRHSEAEVAQQVSA
ncbi:MAG: ATP-binding protein [Marinobacterium sp.]|nr:ATP-binding protein [Marinobacterium sp.]